ncbi:retrotransposon protein, putative, ty1-copia subclass [Tanacetum coccineum]
MGKSVPSAARLQDIASRIITSDRIKHQTKKSVSNKTRVVPPPEPAKPKGVRIVQSQKQQQQQKSKIIMEENNNKLMNKRVPLKEVVLECTRRWFGDTLKEAESGDVNMQVLVGQMFCSGYGVVKDAHKLDGLDVRDKLGLEQPPGVGALYGRLVINAQFYPLAGMNKNDLSIDCNDVGANYVLALVHCRLDDFLRDPDHGLINRFSPFEPSFDESSAGARVREHQGAVAEGYRQDRQRLWRIKMRALLIKYGCEAALEVKVLREVTGGRSGQRGFGTKLRDFVHDKSLLGYIIITTICGTLLYGREALTLKDVMATLNSKEIKERSKAKGDDGEGLYDHLKRNCPKNNRKKSTGYAKKDEQPSSSGSTYDDSEVMMVMSAQALLDLIMDSGCSYHMTPRLDILFDFLECDGGSIQLGDNRECKIREGFTVKMQSGKVKVINGSRVVLSRTRRDNCVYSLDGHAMAGELNASVEEKDSLAQVWHKRLGHISEAGLQVLEKQGLFGKESLGKLNFYENYVLGKSHRVRFGVGRHTTQGVVDYVHSDLWGPSQVESLGVENQTVRTVKKLRTDNGLEFCNREFEQLCIESGIARHLTVAGTPQQNGVAERMNRTLMDKVRYLLIQSGVALTFWGGGCRGEATCTAAYLINRSPSTSIEKKTPIEMWPGHPSDYGMLRIFGCVAYPHNKQGKLEPRAIKCVLLGYPWGMKGTELILGDKSVEELQVEMELQRFNNHTPEEDQIDQEDGDDDDAWDHETDQTPDLTDYQLAQDKERRTRTKPLRFRDESNMAAYALAAVEEVDTHKPLTYQEAVACEDNSKWKAAIKEEMNSLRKNKT